jgi:enoyl-CoA hydratase/carnithine racemase
MDYEAIQYSTADHIGHLTLNRPKSRNAMNGAMIEELEDLFLRLMLDGETRVIVLTGAGDRAFCAGLDMKETAVEMFSEPVERIYAMQSRTPRLFAAMRALPQPIVAAVNGAAYGAGLSLALASDVRLITPQTRFSAAYINVGLGGADLASSFFLPRLIGAGRANEYLLTGAPMDADTAMALGLASRLVPFDELASTAQSLAAEMASKNPLGLRLTKEAINQNLSAVSLEQALHLENRNQAFLIAGLKLASSQNK